MKEEISKYAQELRDNIEKNKSKNKHMIAEMAKEIDKTRNTLEDLEDQQEKIQSAIESTKAAIIFAVAAEHGGWMSNLSFTKLRPEMQEFVSREQHITKAIGILTSVKLSKKSHDAELKALKG
jgi:esterase/lipase